MLSLQTHSICLEGSKCQHGLKTNDLSVSIPSSSYPVFRYSMKGTLDSMILECLVSCRQLLLLFMFLGIGETAWRQLQFGVLYAMWCSLSNMFLYLNIPSTQTPPRHVVPKMLSAMKNYTHPHPLAVHSAFTCKSYRVGVYSSAFNVLCPGRVGCSVLRGNACSTCPSNPENRQGLHKDFSTKTPWLADLSELAANVKICGQQENRRRMRNFGAWE